MYPIIILAGGLGTRLGNLTQDTPKSLIKINEKPFLHWQFELLELNGFTDTTLCLGHFSKKILQYIDNHYTGNLNLSFSYDGDINIGTGGAIKKASQKLDTPFFVIYGDSYLDVNFKEISNSYKTNSGPMMTILHNKNLYDKSNVYMKDGEFFYQKINPPKSAEFIDFGLNIFEKKHLLKYKTPFDLSEIQHHYSYIQQLQFYEVKKRFYEIGSISGIKEFSEYLKNEKNKEL